MTNMIKRWPPIELHFVLLRVYPLPSLSCILVLTPDPVPTIYLPCTLVWSWFEFIILPKQKSFFNKL